MKAYVLYGLNKFNIEESPKPALNEGEVLVKIRAAGISSTDIDSPANLLFISVCDSLQPSSPVSRSLELAQKYREIGVSEFFILHRQGYNWGTIALFL